jgi:two-component system LytT family sensor kinase
MVGLSRGVMREAGWAILVALTLGIGVALLYARRAARQVASPGGRASYQTLHTTNLAAPFLRSGLNAESASRAAPHLRALLGTEGLLVADRDGTLLADNVDAEHSALLEAAVRRVMDSGRPSSLSGPDLRCSKSGVCRLLTGVVVPLDVGSTVVGAMVALDSVTSAGLLRLCGEVAQFVSTQLELAELDRSRQRAVQAELRFLRAQISPHFIYNALTAIESFVRSDPDRARELLVSFADFTRYSFATHAQFTSIAEELRLVDIYLELERARFGDRLDVTLRVAPETLGVHLPSLVLQPLVENAVRHGIEPTGQGHLRIDVSDVDSEAWIAIEDDGSGTDPTHLQRILAGTSSSPSVGLRNVDERLRATFGDEFGLLVETQVGAGTKVTMRVPKFHPSIRPEVSTL